MVSLDNPAVRSLLDGYFQSHPDEAAGLLEGLPAEEIVRVAGTGPARPATGVLEQLSPSAATEALQRMSNGAAKEVLEAMDPSRASILLFRLDEEAREKLLALLDPRTARELQELMVYPPGSAGSLMDPRALTFRPDATVKQAIESLRSLGRKRIHDIFVVNGEGRLVGSVPLQDLVPTSGEEKLEELIRGAAVSVHSLADREEVVELLDKHKVTTLPVVDIEGRLLGVIRHQELMTAVEQEATADIQSMVGVSKEERALSRISFAVRKRLPWLHINLVTAFLAAAVVGLFESTIARFTALAVLLPVVAGQSGNTGAQSLAVTMRGLALREIRLRHWPRVAFKEVSVGALNGIAIAMVTSLGVYVWSRSLGLSFVIGLAMVLSMAVAGIAGAAVPLVLSAMGQDPAQSSSIVLTTITDITGFFSFLGLATLFADML
jgi:magnesium transporter